jgi:hypothetical protein
MKTVKHKGAELKALEITRKQRAGKGRLKLVMICLSPARRMNGADIDGCPRGLKGEEVDVTMF